MEAGQSRIFLCARPGVGAALPEGVAPHCDACELGKAPFEALPDPEREVFQARYRQSLHLVQQSVIELTAQFAARALQLTEVGDKANPRVGLSDKGDLYLERMAVYAAIKVAFWIAVEIMGSVEIEAVRDLHGVRGCR